jgi:flavin-dependent dehydrogenase
LLLQRAVEAGAEQISAESPRPEARCVIAAHGSWQRSGHSLPSDLLGFKAHFLASRLQRGLMPLVLFPGGYGGLVESSAARVSFSCCIRRDALERARHKYPQHSAGEAVLAHAQESCRGLRAALSGASRDGSWLSAGPIRPGFRELVHEGMFRVGTAAGEAHPIVAEGISMAIQSAILLAEALLCGREADYARSWQRNFSTRVRAAACFAHATMHPVTGPMAVALMRWLPSILTLGAAWSGKAQPLEFGDGAQSREQWRF